MKTPVEKKPSNPPDTNVFDEIKRLDAERDKLVVAARDKAMQKADEALAELALLGIHMKLVEENNGSRVGTRTVKDAACEICQFKTDKPHDGRLHRGQETKRPFTDEELQEKGLRRV